MKSFVRDLRKAIPLTAVYLFEYLGKLNLLISVHHLLLSFHRRHGSYDLTRNILFLIVEFLKTSQVIMVQVLK